MTRTYFLPTTALISPTLPRGYLRVIEKQESDERCVSETASLVKTLLCLGSGRCLTRKVQRLCLCLHSHLVYKHVHTDQEGHTHKPKHTWKCTWTSTICRDLLLCLNLMGIFHQTGCNSLKHLVCIWCVFSLGQYQQRTAEPRLVSHILEAVIDNQKKNISGMSKNIRTSD